MRYLITLLFLFSAAVVNAEGKVFEATKTYERPSWLDSGDVGDDSAVEPVYLDCSKERQTLQGFIEPRHNFIRVFKDERMEILDESWSWWSDRPNAGPDSYTVRHEHGFSELDRKTLILKIYWSRFDRTNAGVRQCKIVGFDLIQDQIEEGRAKVDENRRKAEARKKQKNVL